MSILEYWKSHPEYWIALGPKKAEADEAITTRFWGVCPDTLDFVDNVIYKDQFMRHFSRVERTGVVESDVLLARKQVATVVKANLHTLFGLDEQCLYFCLMPLKHIGDFETVFSVIHSWLPVGKSLTEFSVLSRFYNDTYKKAYTEEFVCSNIC